MINLCTLSGTFTIYQLKPYMQIPADVFTADFYSITKTDDEISIVTDSFVTLGNLKSNPGWKGFRVEGILDFSQIGIIHAITQPLKENGVSVFVVSTFNTDYIFVKEEFFGKAIEIFDASNTISIKKN